MALSLVDIQEIPFNASTSPRATSATLTWEAGDLFIVMGAIADSASRSLDTPSMTGLTFSLVGSILNGASHCWGACWQATAGSSGSDDCGTVLNGTSEHWGLVVAQFRGHGGVGGNNSGQADAFQISNTNTGSGGAGSMVIWYGFDWDASAAGVTLTPASGLTERHDEQDAGKYSIYGGTWTGQGAGATTYGLSADGGQRLTQFVVEVLDSEVPAHPVVEGTAESSTNTAGTSHTVTLPASIADTDLVLITMDIGSTAATLNALADWQELLDENVANGLKILRYIGTGVPGNPTFTSSASTRSASIAWRISGADKSITPQIGTTGTGTSATPDPPSVTPTENVTKDYLFIAFAGMAGEEADDDTWGNTPPTNYLPSPPLQKACGTAGTNLGGKIVAASRQLTTGTAEDPGTFGVDVSAAWRSQTIIVHPIGSSKPQIVVPTSAAHRAASW